MGLKSMKKQDRHGVRTPAEIPQRYNLGGTQDELEAARKLYASAARFVEDTRKEMARMSERIDKFAPLWVKVSEADGVYMLSGITYAELKTAWESGKVITLYIDKSADERRYYHCMGSVSGALVFAYRFGGVSEYITCSEGGVTVVTDDSTKGDE